MNEWEWQLLEEKVPVERIVVSGAELTKGARVRLHPRKGGDILDLVLAGKTAVVESIEQDYEGEYHLAVTIDEDPGKDLGILRQPGHRFFFKPAEVEALPKENAGTIAKPKSAKILVAGIGNIFLGDDAFGVEVVRRLSKDTWPKNVRVADFGIRSYDLAYALMDGYDTTILVDASARGETPGTVYVIEPDINEPDENATREPVQPDAHSMNPITVLRMARSMGHEAKRILLVGCEPATFGPEEGLLGLSDPVEAAVGEAVKLVRSLVTQALGGTESQTCCEQRTGGKTHESAV